MKKLIIGLSMLAYAFAAGPASAQFGGLGAKKSNGGTDPDALLVSFAESYTHSLAAQALFADAFGLQDVATTLKAEQQSFSSGQINAQGLNTIREVSDSAVQAIAARMAETPELDAESRALFMEGLVHYGAALVSAKQTADAAQGLAGSLSGNPMALTGSVRNALAVAKEVPTYVNRLRQNTTMVFEYGRRNNIDPPADVTSLLAGL